VTDIPICVNGIPPDGCCLLAIPNTSQWQVVCANTTQPQPTSVPSLFIGSGIILTLAICMAALVIIARKG
jgi:hypothetical protein